MPGKWLAFCIAYWLLGSPPPMHLQAHNRPRMVILQPLGSMDSSSLKFIRTRISQVLQPASRRLPPQFFNGSKGPRYSADSLIHWLKNQYPDPEVRVLGCCREDIYTTVRDPGGKVRQPESRYKVWEILGLGYQPGQSCLISSYRIARKAENRKAYFHYLGNLVMHELGHTAGLAHCSRPGCLMADAREKRSTLDGEGEDFCPDCRRRWDRVMKG